MYSETLKKKKKSRLGTTRALRAMISEGANGHTHTHTILIPLQDTSCNNVYRCIFLMLCRDSCWGKKKWQAGKASEMTKRKKKKGRRSRRRKKYAAILELPKVTTQALETIQSLYIVHSPSQYSGFNEHS